MSNVANWINEEKLTKSQLISISIQENQAKYGETVFWVLTREKPLDELDTPLSKISVKTFSPLDDWNT